MATATVQQHLGYAHHLLKARNTKFVAFMEAKVKEIEGRLRESGKMKRKRAAADLDAALAAAAANAPVAPQVAAAEGDDLSTLTDTLSQEHPPDGAGTKKLSIAADEQDQGPFEGRLVAQGDDGETGLLARGAKAALTAGAKTAAAVHATAQALVDPGAPEVREMEGEPREEPPKDYGLDI